MSGSTEIHKGILSSIVKFSIRFRGIIIALAFVLMGYGIFTLTGSRFEVFPGFAPPQVVIQTEAPGLTPEQVEILVTQPVENGINGVSGIKSIRSGSIQGLSVITVTFSNQNNIYLDRQVISERLTSLAGTLPQGVHTPIISPLTSSTSVIMSVGLTSNKLSLMDLRTITDWTIKQRLLSVPGVAKIAVYGGEVKEIQVLVKPEKLIKYHLSLTDILNAAKQSTGIEGAGFIDTPNQRINLLSKGQSIDPSDIAKTVVAQKNGVNITLGNVAKVAIAPANQLSAALINGKPGVILVISNQLNSNTLEVTKSLLSALKDLKPVLTKNQIYVNSDIFRASDFIETSIGNITSSLLVGAVLVIIVLTLFLFNFRTAAISCLAIPLSLLTAIIVLEKLGISLNTMTLGGLAIAIGEVVDDAVIDVENILRRLRENRLSNNPGSKFKVILDASLEVRSAVVYATFTVILVFFPILMMKGVAGKLFSPLGVSYILAILASLLVALTVTPALSFLLLNDSNVLDKEPPPQTFLKKKYIKILRRIENSPRTVIISVIIITILGLSALPFFGSDFIPKLRENHIILHETALPGTSLEQSMMIGKKIARKLLKLPFVISVGGRTGRAELGDDILGTHDSEIDITIKRLNGAQSAAAINEIRNALKDFRGVTFALKTFLSERIEETLSGYTAMVVVNIYGNDLDELDRDAKETANVLNSIKGAEEVKIQSQQEMPELVISLNKNKIEQYGLRPVEVLNAIHAAYEGAKAGQIFNNNQVYDLTVKLDPSIRNKISEVPAISIENSSGTYIPLGELANIYETTGRYVILHDGARRVQTVTCNVKGRAVNSFVNEAKKKLLNKVNLQPGSYFSFSGTAQEQSNATRDLILYSIISLIGIIILLSIVMNNFKNLFLVLTNLPFALIGGVLIIFISGGRLSLGSMVGFVTLFGITLRNSIMLISHYEHLVNYEGMNWNLETALQGASERLIPIMMTAIVTALGLLPLALGSGDPGREIEGPMAVVILGGLVTSTALNLLILPALSLRFGKFVKKEAD
ncbi:MAG: efflux RND transporter permease subunit [Ignavibacteriaceae bacterium]